MFTDAQRNLINSSIDTACSDADADEPSIAWLAAVDGIRGAQSLTRNQAYVLMNILDENSSAGDDRAVWDQVMAKLWEITA